MQSQWQQENPLAQFDFMKEPQEDWAKQLLRAPRAFDNVLTANGHSLDPRAYFLVRSPDFGELQSMLAGMSYEKDVLKEQNSQTLTFIRGNTHHSEPFEYSAVSEEAKRDAALFAKDVTPVEQQKVNVEKEKRVESIRRIDEADNRGSDVDPGRSFSRGKELAGSEDPAKLPDVESIPRGEDSLLNQTIPVEPVHMDPVPRGEPPQTSSIPAGPMGPAWEFPGHHFPLQIDLTRLQQNVPSLLNPKIGTSFAEVPSLLNPKIGTSFVEAPSLLNPKIGTSFAEAPSNENSLQINQSLYDPPSLPPNPTLPPNPIVDKIPVEEREASPAGMEEGPILTSFLDHSKLDSFSVASSPSRQKKGGEAELGGNPQAVEEAVFGSILNQSSLDLGAAASPTSTRLYPEPQPELPTPFSKFAAQQNETPIPNSENPANNREIPMNQRENPMNQREIPTNQREIPINNPENPINNPEIPSHFTPPEPPIPMNRGDIRVQMDGERSALCSLRSIAHSEHFIPRFGVRLRRFARVARRFAPNPKRFQSNPHLFPPSLPAFLSRHLAPPLFPHFLLQDHSPPRGNHHNRGFLPPRPPHRR